MEREKALEGQEEQRNYIENADINTEAENSQQQEIADKQELLMAYKQEHQQQSLQEQLARVYTPVPDEFEGEAANEGEAGTSAEEARLGILKKIQEICQNEGVYREFQAFLDQRSLARAAHDF